MKFSIFTISFLFSIQAFSIPIPKHNIRIKAEVVHEGKRITRTSIQVRPGKKGRVLSDGFGSKGTSQKYALEITPSNVSLDKKSPIQVDFNLSIKGLNDEMVNQGQLRAKEGVPTIVSLDRGRTLIKMIAERVID